MARFRRIETGEGVARVEPLAQGGGDTFNVYRGGWGEDRIGMVTVDHRGTSREVWTWWNGVKGDPNGGTAASETEAVAALLRAYPGE